MREEKDFLETELRRFQPYPKYKDSGVEWLGKIPAHWNALSLKKICRLAYGDALQSEERRMGVVEVFGSNGAVGIHDRANTGGPCLVVGRKGSFGKINYSSNPVFAIDTTFFVDRHLSDADLRWLFYILTWLRLDTISKDSAIPGLGREDVYACLVPSCNQKEQQGIAAFLDRETAKIDALIEKKERLIELLQEKRTALITQAVTKGLDPNVLMKDSDVEWLGEIPAHWETAPIRSLARPGCKTFTDGDWIESPFIRDEGIRLIQTGNIGIGSYKEQGFRYIDEETFRAFRCTEIMLRDVLICRLADPVGRACLAPDLGVRMITSVDVCILKPANGIDAAFVVYALSGKEYLSWMAGICRGGTRDRVSRSMLGSIRVQKPPYKEQQEIAAFLDRETAKIDALVAKKERLIELLQEKRTALISAAVTGKIDVRLENI